MLFISEYTLKPHLTKSEVKRLMGIFGKRGAVEGEIANYVRADGTGGFTIAENDDLTSALPGRPLVLGVHDVYRYSSSQH